MLLLRLLSFWVLFLTWSKKCSSLLQNCCLASWWLCYWVGQCIHQQSRVNLATCAKSVAPVNFMIAFQPVFCPFLAYSWTRFMAVSTARDGGGWRKLKAKRWVLCDWLLLSPHPGSQVGDFIDPAPCQKLWYHSHHTFASTKLDPKPFFLLPQNKSTNMNTDSNSPTPLTQSSPFCQLT